MKSIPLKGFFVFALILCSFKLFSQAVAYQKYIVINEQIEGFSQLSFNAIPKKVQDRINRELKKNIFDSEDTIVYSVSESENYCVRFLQKYYEGTFIIIDSMGNKIHSIIFINPEYSEFGQIYDQISESNYVFPMIESPYGPIRKNITPTKTWFEVFLGKQENEDFETVLIFNDHFKQIAIEKN